MVLIHGAPATNVKEITDEEILSLLKKLTTKDTAEQLSKSYGVSKKELYQRIINLKK